MQGQFQKQKLQVENTPNANQIRQYNSNHNSPQRGNHFINVYSPITQNCWFKIVKNENKNTSNPTRTKNTTKPLPQQLNKQPKQQNFTETHSPLYNLQKNKQIDGNQTDNSDKTYLFNHTIGMNQLNIETFYGKKKELSLQKKGNLSVRRNKLPEEVTSQQQTLFLPQTKKKQQRWEDQKLPMTPDKVIELFDPFLSIKEVEEIKQYQYIYYIGHKADKHLLLNQRYQNAEVGEFNFVANDHIAYRYEIIEKLGQGSFGLVIKCFDHKMNQQCAVKVIRNKKRYSEQALIEIRILKHIALVDKEKISNAVEVYDYFNFRSHMCIVFELLSLNLYELMRRGQFQGITIDVIRRFAIQILQSLSFLKRHQIIHCDLKPENILLKQLNKSGLKIVDFGSSCFKDETIYTYIQSRFYRAPEVILGYPYTTQIDMWSFGCIIAELEIGYPLFPGENEEEQIQMVYEVIGIPPRSYLEKIAKKSNFFSEDGKPKLLPNSQGNVHIPNSKILKQFFRSQFDQDFINFVTQCLGNWESRLKPEQALIHPWIVNGLPQHIKEQHLHQVRKQFNTNQQETCGSNLGEEEEDVHLQQLLQKQITQKENNKMKKNLIKKK